MRIGSDQLQINIRLFRSQVNADAGERQNNLFPISSAQSFVQPNAGIELRRADAHNLNRRED